MFSNLSSSRNVTFQLEGKSTPTALSRSTLSSHSRLSLDGESLATMHRNQAWIPGSGEESELSRSPSAARVRESIRTSSFRDGMRNSVTPLRSPRRSGNDRLESESPEQLVESNWKRSSDLVRGKESETKTAEPKGARETTLSAQGKLLDRSSFIRLKEEEHMQRHGLHRVEDESSMAPRSTSNITLDVRGIPRMASFSGFRDHLHSDTHVTSHDESRGKPLSSSAAESRVLSLKTDFELPSRSFYQDFSTPPKISSQGNAETNVSSLSRFRDSVSLFDSPSTEFRSPPPAPFSNNAHATEASTVSASSFRVKPFGEPLLQLLSSPSQPPVKSHSSPDVDGNSFHGPSSRFQPSKTLLASSPGSPSPSLSSSAVLESGDLIEDLTTMWELCFVSDPMEPKHVLIDLLLERKRQETQLNGFKDWNASDLPASSEDIFMPDLLSRPTLLSETREEPAEPTFFDCLVEVMQETGALRNFSIPRLPSRPPSMSFKRYFELLEEYDAL